MIEGPVDCHRTKISDWFLTFHHQCPLFFPCQHEIVDILRPNPAGTRWRIDISVYYIAINTRSHVQILPLKDMLASIVQLLGLHWVYQNSFAPKMRFLFPIISLDPYRWIPSLKLTFASRNGWLKDENFPYVSFGVRPIFRSYVIYREDTNQPLESPAATSRLSPFWVFSQASVHRHHQRAHHNCSPVPLGLKQVASISSRRSTCTVGREWLKDVASAGKEWKR